MPINFKRTMVVLLIGLAMPSNAQPASASVKAIEAYVQPYVDTRNFSGVIMVAKADRTIFAKSYGSSDFARRVPNRLDTRFHVASMSMQFTAAAALRLVQAGKLSLDEPVSSFVPDLPNGGKITIRHLLTQTSGIRDINGLPQYDDLLKSHQTPLALVDKIRGLPAEHEPGTFVREEHSAYNLLALIIERRTRLPFARAMKTLVFEPLHMTDSGIDDDGLRAGAEFAVGHAPRGTQEVEPAERVHWSAKAGNASAYTTAGDELRFVRGMFDPKFLRADLRDAVFDLSTRVGYGWFKSNSTRFGQPVYSMNGRAPGFASALIYVPREQLAVVAFSNIYASFTPDIAGDVTALVLGLPYQPLMLKESVDVASLNGLPAKFRFPPEFYQPNAVVSLTSAESAVSLRWPSGDVSPLIPTSTDHYVDRAYGVPVELVRDGAGHPASLKYDKFVGEVIRK